MNIAWEYLESLKPTTLWREYLIPLLVSFNIVCHSNGGSFNYVWLKHVVGLCKGFRINMKWIFLIIFCQSDTLVEKKCHCNCQRDIDIESMWINKPTKHSQHKKASLNCTIICSTMAWSDAFFDILLPTWYSTDTVVEKSAKELSTW